MPIYEYRCKKCGNDFELLVMEDTRIVCDSCGSTSVEKQFSTFAVQHGGGKTRETAPSCSSGCGEGFSNGTCGSGMCGGG